MRKRWRLAIVSGVVFGVTVFILTLLLVKWLWAWTIPDLFPQAVAQNLIVARISWFTALKLAVFISVLAGVAGVRRRDKDNDATVGV